MLTIYNNQTFNKVNKADLFTCFIPNNEIQTQIVEDVSPIWHGKGHITFEQWKEMLSFFYWGYNKTRSEQHITIYYNEILGEFLFYPFPQRCMGMTVREAEELKVEYKSKYVPPEYEFFGSVHHHCTGSAFQSSVDEKDEDIGFHATIGEITSMQHSLHARWIVRDPVCGKLTYQNKDQHSSSGLNMMSLFNPFKGKSGFDNERDLYPLIRRQLCLKPTTQSFPKHWEESIITTSSSAYFAGVGNNYRTTNTRPTSGYYDWSLKRWVDTSYDEDTAFGFGEMPQIPKNIQTTPKPKSKKKTTSKKNEEADLVYNSIVEVSYTGDGIFEIAQSNSKTLTRISLDEMKESPIYKDWIYEDTHRAILDFLERIDIQDYITIANGSMVCPVIAPWSYLNGAMNVHVAFAFRCKGETIGSGNADDYVSAFVFIEPNKPLTSIPLEGLFENVINKTAPRINADKELVIKDAVVYLINENKTITFLDKIEQEIDETNQKVIEFEELQRWTYFEGEHLSSTQKRDYDKLGEYFLTNILDYDKLSLNLFAVMFSSQTTWSSQTLRDNKYLLPYIVFDSEDGKNLAQINYGNFEFSFDLESKINKIMLMDKEQIMFALARAAALFSCYSDGVDILQPNPRQFQLINNITLN